VRELRAAGVSAADVIGQAAAAVGLLPAPRPIPASDVAGLFTRARLRKPRRFFRV